MDNSPKKFESTWDKEGNFLCVRYWGDHDVNDAQQVADELTRIAEKKERPFGVLNDLRECGKATKQAMVKYGELVKSAKISKHAFLVPASGAAKVIPDLLIKMSGADNAKLFHDEKKAMEYLNE